MDRIEILMARLRHLVSRNRWSARLLGYHIDKPGGHEPGLVLIQIDGLGHEILLQAMAEGRMPFLKHLLEAEDRQLHRLYTGMPSSTPGVQAELFYGVKSAVPAFGYFDHELGRVVSMNDPVAAAAVEERLRRNAVGLLRGGSSWSNIFTGGADEPHLCAATAGLDMLWQALNPLRMVALILWYGWSIVRILTYLLVETGLALYDFFRGALRGLSVWAELRFVPTRVIVGSVMREMVTAGAAIDCERGLPVIHLNFLGYDEHAHRRGPDSRFARWTLRGIDRAVRRPAIEEARLPGVDLLGPRTGAYPALSPHATRGSGHCGGKSGTAFRDARGSGLPRPATTASPVQPGHGPFALVATRAAAVDAPRGEPAGRNARGSGADEAGSAGGPHRRAPGPHRMRLSRPLDGTRRTAASGRTHRP